MMLWRFGAVGVPLRPVSADSTAEIAGIVLPREDDVVDHVVVVDAFEQLRLALAVVRVRRSRTP
jgi:hypothetical protein